MRIRVPQSTAPATPHAATVAERGQVIATDDSWPGSEILDDPATARVFFQALSGDRVVIAKAPPGAGKTRLVVLLALALAHYGGLRVAVAAQTKAQACQISARLSGRTSLASLLWKKNTPAPGSGTVPTVDTQRARWPARGGGIIVAVAARWLYADPDRLGADVLIVDEAWQMTYADLGALGALAGQIVAVGDPGQIDPVVTGNTRRWAGNPTAPHLPAPQAMLAAYPTAVHSLHLPHTWRLGAETTALIQPIFYADLPFTSRRPPECLLDASGAVLPELTQRPLRAVEGPTDPVLLDECAQRVRELLGCRHRDSDGVIRPLTGEDITVVVPHVAQAATVRAALADEPDVLVGTANSLQGLERAASVVLHPLAGYRSAEPFALEPGRVCVGLSRHRTHATVIHDAATPDILRCADTTPEVTLNAHLLDAVTALPRA
ncbi:AAA family ATPase [Nocardia sp. IFM 10818]